jgi:hypothetical protein
LGRVTDCRYDVERPLSDALRPLPTHRHFETASSTESRSDVSPLPGMAIPGVGHTHEPSPSVAIDGRVLAGLSI